MPETANPEQADYWNAEPGRNWVTHQEDFDAIGREATDRLMAACDARRGEHVLDVGCGSGTTSLAFAAAVGPAGSVLGLDISEPLLARAEARRRDLGVGNLAFALGDAEVHPLAPGRHDLAASRFGVMFFADPVAAFRNIARGLRPGGRMVFAVWAGPEHNPFFTLALRAAVERLGPVPPADPDAPGPMAFRDPGRVLGLLAAAGLADGHAETFDADLHHPGGIDAILRFVPKVGPIARLLREKGGTEDDRAAIIASLAAALEPFRSADGIRIPARFILYTARTPD